MNTHDTPTRTVGRRIARLRRAAHLTQADFAQRLGWPRDTLVHYEMGRRGITVDRLVAMAAALQIPPAVLLIDDEPLAALVARLIHEPEIQQQVLAGLAGHDETAADGEKERGAR